MIQAPIPQPNETQEHYTVRAHQALMHSVEDPDERNTMIWSAWAHQRGQTMAEKVADREHESDRFVKVPNYCYFKEHETLDNQGNPIRFGVGDLVEIATNMNRRVGAKAFPAISDNHTSPTDQSHQGDPPVLGAAGAHRIGMIQDTDGQQKYSIFADEYHYSHKAADLASKPRRSVELITFKNTGERFFDPIAALGGRAPRLAMPTRFGASSSPAFSVCKYSTDTGPVEAIRYQVEGPAMLPSGGNTHLKSTDYYDGDDPAPEAQNMLSISDEDIAKIVNAVGNMPELVHVRQQMDAENGGAVDPSAEGGLDDVGGPIDGGMDNGMNGDELGGGLGPDVDQNSAMVGPNSGQPVATPPGDDSAFDEQQQFMAEGGLETDTQFEEETDMYSAENQVSIQRYEALSAEHAALKTSHMNLLAQVGGMAEKQKTTERAQTDAARTSDIYEISSRYSMFNAAEECERLLYSAGNEVSDEQFAKEMSRMIQLGNRQEQLDVQNAQIPQGTTRSQYSAQQHQQQSGNVTIERNAAWWAKQTEIHLQHANRGEQPHFDQLADLTDKAMGMNGQAV